MSHLVSFLFVFDVLNALDVDGMEAHSNIAQILWPKQEDPLLLELPPPQHMHAPLTTDPLTVLSLAKRSTVRTASK